MGEKVEFLNKLFVDNQEILVPVSILVLGAVLFLQEIRAYVVGMVFAFIATLLFRLQREVKR